MHKFFCEVLAFWAVSVFYTELKKEQGRMHNKAMSKLNREVERVKALLFSPEIPDVILS